MLTKNEIKLINSLSIKKYRDNYKLFVVDGHKIVSEIVDSTFEIEFLIHTKDFIPINHRASKIVEVSEDEIKKISNFNSPPNVIVIVKIPDKQLSIKELKDKLTLSIDAIQDPGNLGTIIRICDWFGIENLILSKNSVDLYNSKVIQATMGAFLRVNVFYTDLEKFIIDYKSQTNNQCYGAFLEGENIYNLQKPKNCLLVMGNEGNGISQQVENQIDKKIFIPPFNPNNHSESLNLSVATAIVCNEFRLTRYHAT